MGVFLIKCTLNGKSLIDHSAYMGSKWNRHKMELKFGNHKNRDLQNDWNTYVYSNHSRNKQNRYKSIPHICKKKNLIRLVV